MTGISMGPGISVAELKNMTAIRMAQQTQAANSVGNQRLSHQSASNLSSTRSVAASEYSTYVPIRTSDSRTVSALSGHSRGFSGPCGPAPLSAPRYVLAHDGKEIDNTSLATPTLSRAQSSGRLVHGLTVEELKELTKLRLKAQGVASHQKVVPSSSNLHTMRRASSMPYSGCSSMSAAVDNYAASIASHKLLRISSQFRNFEQVCEDFSTQSINEECARLININESTSPKVLSQSASRCSTPTQNRQLSPSSSDSPISVIHSILDSNLAPHSSLHLLSPQHQNTSTTTSKSSLTVQPRESFSFDNGGCSVLDSSYLLNSQDDDTVYKALTSSDVFELDSKVEQLSPAKHGISHMQQWLNEHQLKNQCSGHLPSVSPPTDGEPFQSISHNGNRKPVHLRINSIDAFPMDSSSSVLNTENGMPDEVDSIFSKTADQPSGKSAIATQVAEFALLTPVATQSSTSPIKIWSPKWGLPYSSGYQSSYESRPHVANTSCNSASTYWETSAYSNVNSSTQDTKKNTNSIFFGGPRDNSINGESSFNSKFAAMNPTCGSSEIPTTSTNSAYYENRFLSKDNGLLQHLGHDINWLSNSSNSPRIFETVGIASSGISDFPSYTQTSSTGLLPSYAEFLQKESDASVAVPHQNSYLFWGPQSNHGAFNYSDGESMQAPLFMHRNWSDIYQF